MAGKRSKNVVKIDPKTGMKTVSDTGIPYGEWVNDKAMHQQIKGSLLQDANGEVVYRGGAPVPLSKRQLDASNALVGSQVAKAIESLTPDEVLALPDGHVKVNDDGSIGGRFISDEILAKIDTAGILNPSQVDNLRAVNAILKDFDGSPMSVMYQSAIETKGSARNKKRYGSIAPAIKNVVPYGFEITAAGNVNIRLVDIVKIADNANRYIKTGQGKRLYGTDVQGGVTKIMRDLEKHMDNWGKRESNADYWAAQEGGSMAKGKDKRDFLNAVSGYTTGDQVKVNPFMDAAPLPGGEKAVKGTTAVRTYRVDRINSVYKLQGSKFHYGYESAKQNLLPEPVTGKARDEALRDMHEQGGGAKNSSNPEGMWVESVDADLRQSSPAMENPRAEVGPTGSVGRDFESGIISELSPEGPPPRYNYTFQQEGKIRDQFKSLLAIAEDRGIRLDPQQEKRIASSASRTMGGEEHDVFFHQQDPGFVIKKTKSQSGFPGAAPAQYLDRWRRLGTLFPEIEPRLHGVSESSIYVKQPFVEGSLYGDRATLQSDMAARNLLVTGGP